MNTSNEFSEKRLLDRVNEILEQETVRDAIREDLSRTILLGYKESWKLGLITPETDWVFMGTDIQRIPPGISNLEAAMRLVEVQTRMMALLFPIRLFGGKGDSLQVNLGNMASAFQNTYPLVRSPRKGGYMSIEEITARAPAYSPEWKDSSSGVPILQILLHVGFPLKTEYQDGDPRTVKRLGLVDSQGLVRRPDYFVQRSLIDDEGNLLYLGLDNSKAILAAMPKLRPVEHVSAIRKVLRRVSLTPPIIRYHTFPFESETLLSVLDIPPTLPGWTDLVISSSGRGRLFIAMDRSPTEWQRMMNLLKELLISTLRSVEFRLLNLTKNADIQDGYLTKKESILRECYLIKDLDRVI